MIDGVNDAVIILDKEGYVTKVNTAATILLHKGRDTVQGWKVGDLLEHNEQLLEVYTKLEETGQPQVLEDTFLNVAKGTTVAAISVNLYCMPICTAKGSTEASLLVMQPIVIKR
ncbi:MAG: PAS domain-containing protein [Candidatus Pacebacteria bacterium]|nr:PAS domain-containing protein [Candidatus Paceibacterota bacterium]